MIKQNHKKIQSYFQPPPLLLSALHWLPSVYKVRRGLKYNLFIWFSYILSLKPDAVALL